MQAGDTIQFDLSISNRYVDNDDIIIEASLITMISIIIRPRRTR